MLIIRSPAFDHNQSIPGRYTCEGENVSPPLQWEGVPEEARSLVLIVDDPDAPDPAAPKVVWVHWVMYNLPADCTGLAEGIAVVDLPPGTQTGRNDWDNASYGGPCPPIGRHRYFHKLYALGTVLPDMGPCTKSEVEQAMASHVLAQAELIGTYQKA